MTTTNAGERTTLPPVFNLARKGGLGLLTLITQLILRPAWLALRWLFSSKWRLVLGAWLVGFFMVGRTAAAYGDGLVVGPDLGSGGGQTVFERIDTSAFMVPIQLSSSHHGSPWLEETMWNLLNALESIILILLASIARGAIVCMQWLLNLTLYSDNRIEIDTAVRAVALQVFWPLFGSTLAIAGFVAYARSKRSGGGTIFADVAWLIAASIFAAAFALAPSASLTTLDDTRTAISTAAMTGYASAGSAGSSAAGFPAVQLPNDLPGATRKLSDSMWNTYVVTPWCYVAFNDGAICKDVGKDYLTNDQRWQDLKTGLANKGDDKAGQYCPNEFNAQCDWIRGQSFGRAGAVIFVAFVTLPMVALLIALVVFGLMAIIGFLLLILVGIIFVLGWMIPGRPREIGMRWFEELIGALFQSVIITAVIGAVMVLSSILNSGIDKYGYFVVGLFNVAVFITGIRMRAKLENVVGMGGGSGASPFSSYMAMRGIGALGKGALRMTKGTAKAGISAVPVVGAAASGGVRAAGQTATGLGRLAGQGVRALAPLDNRPPPAPGATTAGTARPTATATPYRRPGGAAGSGRRPVIEPIAARTGRPGGAARQLPGTGGDGPGGRVRQLPATPGPAPVEMTPGRDGEGRAFTAGDVPARRTFAATSQRGEGAAVVTESRQGTVGTTRQGRPGRRVVEHSAPPSSAAGARATNLAISAGQSAAVRAPRPVSMRKMPPLADAPPRSARSGSGSRPATATPRPVGPSPDAPPVARQPSTTGAGGTSRTQPNPRELAPLGNTPPPRRLPTRAGSSSRQPQSAPRHATPPRPATPPTPPPPSPTAPRQPRPQGQRGTPQRPTGHREDER